MGYGPWGRRELDTTEGLHFLFYCAMLSHFSGVRGFVVPWEVAPPDSSVHGILQARILGRVAVPYSRGSPRSKD